MSRRHCALAARGGVSQLPAGVLSRMLLLCCPLRVAQGVCEVVEERLPLPLGSQCWLIVMCQAVNLEISSSF